jgi:predicted tellurium resistance membrane protein TerC
VAPVEEDIMTDWIVPLVTLTGLEIILGIDNIIFLAILAGKLPREQQAKARRLGLLLALGTRLALLAFINLLMSATTPLFFLPEWIFSEPDARGISFKDIVLIAGGLFLVAKATWEIHHKLEGDEEPTPTAGAPGSGSKFGMVLLQIVLIDIVFSLDSVITAVGMVKTEGDHVAAPTQKSDEAAKPEHPAPASRPPRGGIWIIVAAMILTCLVMLFAAGPVGDFVGKHPTLKVLALSFLILIGVLLIAEGFGQHLNKGYIYFAMAFSLVVELLNMRVRAHEKPVQLHEPHMPQEPNA